MASSLFMHFRDNIFFWNHFVWRRITDEGSLPEMHIWSILLITSELKWCIHLSRSLFIFLISMNIPAVGNKWWPLTCMYIFQLQVHQYLARIHKGDRGSGPPPPRDLSGVGSCVDASLVGEGVQRLFYHIIIIFFWLASLASIIQIYYMYTYFHVQCSVCTGHPFSIFPLSK